MGRGRRGLIDQIQKKPTIGKDEEKREVFWWSFQKHDKKDPLFLTDDDVDMMKQINPFSSLLNFF